MRAGRLPGGGRVVAVVEESPRTTLISTLRRWRLEYAGDAAGAPAHVLLKAPRTDGAVSFVDQGRREAAFYTTVAPLSPGALLPQCFDVVCSDGGELTDVLLEDLSSTHRVLTDWPLPPTRDHCEQLLDAYARFHAAWWDHDALGVSIGRFTTDAEFDQYRTRLAESWASFRAMVGDRLSPERAERISRFLDAMPRLLGRYRSRRHLTIVHGDAHVWNALIPHDAAETVRLIDWAGWRIGIATGDLAYMMALHWYPERRARLEQPLLRYYHHGGLRAPPKPPAFGRT